MELDKSYVLQNIIDEIVEATKAVEADGVTIDFSGIPSELNNAYHFFIKRFSKRLQQEDVEYWLNVIVENLAEFERCPNRDIISGVPSIVAGIYIIIILSAIVFFELRDFLKKYIFYVIGLGLTIVVVFISIVICVPFWRGYQTEITL